MIDLVFDRYRPIAPADHTVLSAHITAGSLGIEVEAHPRLLSLKLAFSYWNRVTFPRYRMFWLRGGARTRWAQRWWLLYRRSILDGTYAAWQGARYPIP